MLLGQLAYGFNTLTSKNVLLKRESKKTLALMSSRASSSIVVVIFAKVSPCKV